MVVKIIWSTESIFRFLYNPLFNIIYHMTSPWHNLAVGPLVPTHATPAIQNNTNLRMQKVFKFYCWLDIRCKFLYTELMDISMYFGSSSDPQKLYFVLKKHTNKKMMLFKLCEFISHQHIELYAEVENWQSLYGKHNNYITSSYHVQNQFRE